MRKNEMGGECGTYRRQKRCLRVLVGDHLEDLGLGGRMILKQMFKTWHGSTDRIDVAQDRDRWRALFSAVMNPGVAENSGHFLNN
jgi:hypothetical protein